MSAVEADDLFAGAGGWSVACQRLGIHDRGVELMKEARATREVVGHTTIHDDVWTFCPDGRATGSIASAPCPTFSPAGKGSGRRALGSVLAAISDGAYRDLDRLREYPVADDDDRTRLVLTPLHFATQYEYEWIAWEQVSTVLPVWEACAGELRKAGFSVWTGNLQAEMYGVPQTRKRAFLLASRTRTAEPPVPTHSRYYPRTPERLDEGVKKWISMAEALGWGLQERPSPTVTGGGTETGGAEPIAKIVERWTTRPDWAFRRPSTTIVGSFKPEIVAAPGYRVTVSRQNAPDSVRVTVHEAGVLQSFPENYGWQGAQGKQFLQAGNAVPPLLAEPVLSVIGG